jgi:hypothetical protein
VRAARARARWGHLSRGASVAAASESLALDRRSVGAGHTSRPSVGRWESLCRLMDVTWASAHLTLVLWETVAQAASGEFVSRPFCERAPNGNRFLKGTQDEAEKERAEKAQKAGKSAKNGARRGKRAPFARMPRRAKRANTANAGEAGEARDAESTKVEMRTARALTSLDFETKSLASGATDLCRARAESGRKQDIVINAGSDGRTI